jgi:hypothetical protein
MKQTNQELSYKARRGSGVFTFSVLSDLDDPNEWPLEFIDRLVADMEAFALYLPLTRRLVQPEYSREGMFTCYFDVKIKGSRADTTCFDKRKRVGIKEFKQYLIKEYKYQTQGAHKSLI